MSTIVTENVIVEQGQDSGLAAFFLFFLIICVFGFSVAFYVPTARYITIAILVIATLLVFLSKSPVKSEIDLRNGMVSIHYRSRIGKSRVRNFPLNEFQSVRTYFDADKMHADHVVVLVGDGKPSLTIAKFKATGEWGTRNQIEGDDARALREEIAKKCALKDDGFRGSRLQWKG